MTDEGFKRKLTAILSADVEGYSRLMGEDEDATIRTLTSYRELMSTLIQKHRGRVVDSPGDNLLAEFLSVVDAVRCAVEIQEELRVRNAELPGNRQMKFRIGVNLGDVVEEGERIYGDGVNITARVERLAEAGGICISGTVYDSIKKKLSLSYESLGEHTVKNIKEPVRVYRMRIGPEAAAPGVRTKKAGLRHWQKAALTAVAVLVVLAVVMGIWQFYVQRPSVEPASVQKMALPLPERPSLAVLPFDNLSGDKEQDYLADGLTENIIDALSKIPDMFIIARHSTHTYKGKPVKIQQIAEDLGVKYLLEGSVQKSGEQIRVTAQLIDALKGHHVWSEKYDRKLEELFTVQDDITLNIAIEMELRLTEGEQARMRHSTDNLEAWSLASKAKSFIETNRLDENSKARELFKKAVKLDPNYAYAWVMLSWTHFIDGYFYPSHYDQKKSFKRAEEIAQKVLEIDDKLSDAFALLSFAYLTQRRFDEALVAGKKAIALGPNDSENHALVAIVIQYLGDGETMINLIKKAMRLDPYFPGWYWFRLAMGNRLLEQYEEAVAILEKMRERGEKANRPHFITYIELAPTYVMMGRMEEARACVTKLLEINPKISVETWRKHQLYKDPEYTERILEALRKAGLPEHPPLPLPDKPSIAVLPFDNLSDDPEQKYFSDGMTDDLITDLSKISGLFVIARNSAFQYKGKAVDVKKVSRDLGVRYVLEGSVRRAENMVRINAQLIDATTGGHLWAERYDEPERLAALSAIYSG
jgi:TolB-like protein/class 3 adenylate cyclase